MTVRVVASIERPADRAEQHVQRFRRRDDDVRRGAAHALALARRGIPGSNPGSDIHIGQALLPQRCANAGERSFQVALNVVGQGLERGDVDDLGLVGETSVQSLPYQGIDRREKGGQRLARAGRRGDQRVTPRLDGRPGMRLRRSGRGEAVVEPRRDRGMKQGRNGHGQDAIRAFSGKVETGFPQKMRPAKEVRARFQFNLIETRSRGTSGRTRLASSGRDRARQRPGVRRHGNMV